MATSSVHVTHIEWEWDMRSKLPLLNHHRARRLRPGECFIVFNRRFSIARIVDAMGGFHEFRAEPGDKFDLDSIRELMQKGWFVPLQVGAKVLALRPPEPKKKTKSKRADPKKAPRRARASRAA